jgi:hypothetical protein
LHCISKNVSCKLATSKEAWCHLPSEIHDSYCTEILVPLPTEYTKWTVIIEHWWSWVNFEVHFEVNFLTWFRIKKIRSICLFEVNTLTQMYFSSFFKRNGFHFPSSLKIIKFIFQFSSDCIRDLNLTLVKKTEQNNYFWCSFDHFCGCLEPKIKRLDKVKLV